VNVAIVVPGSGSVAPDGVYRIGHACLALVREAERLADALAAETVVFSGWAPRGGTPEAEQMRAAWRGADVELVVEPTAAVTAHNASRTLPLLLERGITRAVVVCTRLHSLRARYFFSRLYGPAGIDTSFRIAPIAASPSALIRELFALPLCMPQLRAARAEVARRLAT
jgi:uncharacterized SAM-binding protein YcdF (DUF218 family)